MGSKAYCKWAGVVAGLLGFNTVQAELTYQAIYTGPPSDPLYVLPFSGLTEGSDRNFYGTSPELAPLTKGTLFRATASGGLGILTTFSGPNGSAPAGGLVSATDGNLYGVTAKGGASGFGTIYRVNMKPPIPGAQTIHSFNGADGTSPFGALVQAADGNLYGVTGGSSSNPPTVFRAATNGTVTTLTNLSTFARPNDGLAEGPDGWLYGTTEGNGVTSFIGSIYKVSTNGDFQTLHSFTKTSDGSNPHPRAGLTAGNDSFLYGTIGISGPQYLTNNYGSIFRMTTSGVMTTLFSFSRTNGSDPGSRLILASDGSLYGTTTQGGLHGYGTIYRITTNGELTTLFDFAGTNGGGNSLNGGVDPSLLQVSDGNFYGTTVGFSAVGGSWGIVFRLIEQPVLSLSQPAGSALDLSWNSFSGGVYRVSYNSAPDTGSWGTLVFSLTATGSTTTVSTSIAGSSQRYFRIQLLP